MAIGKPLLVQERQGVQQPVLSTQTQQLSSQVHAQKIQLADYNIGMRNAVASQAVNKELVNMVGAGIQAKLYIDQTKQEYQRLNLMEEWQKSDAQYNADFAKARTPEAQQGVLDSYSKDLETRTASWRQALPNTADSQKYLSFLRNGSQKQFSKFSTTVSNGIHKRTADLEQLNIKRIAKSLTTEKNSDVVSGMNASLASYANLVKIGALTAEQAEFGYSELQDAVVSGRANLFATDLAKQYASSGTPLPTDEEFATQLNAAMGVKLDGRRLTLARETYTDAFYKELTERQRQVTAEENYALKVTEEGRLKLEADVNEAIDNKAVSPELKAKLIDQAHAFDYAKPGFGLKIEKKFREAEHGTSYKPFVEHFTSGEGRKVILETIKASGTSYFDLKELRSHLETMGGKYEGMNESTIREIITHWRGINQSTRKGLFDQTEDVMQVTLMSILRDKTDDRPAWLKGETLAKLNVDGAMLTQMANPLALNWSKTMEYSKAHSKAWNVTLADVKAEFDSKQGVFSKDNLNQPADTQRAMLERYVTRLLDKNFSEAVNEELSRLDNEKRIKQEKIAAVKQREEAERKKKVAGFAMESLKEGVPPDKPTATPTKISPHAQLLETQKAKKRIRNAQYASTFKDQVTKGQLGSAMSTAIASKFTDITQSIRDAHEESNFLYENDPTRHRLNDRSGHLKDMAVMTKNAKQMFAGGIWDKLAKAVGQGEPMTIEGFSNDMGLLVGTVGDLLIDGAENHAIEKTPITETKRTPITTPNPLATPEPTKPPDTSTATGLPVVEQTPTALDQLTEGLAGNPVVGQLANAVSSLVNPTEAEGAEFNPTAIGARYFDANSQPTNVMPLDVRQNILDNPDAYPQFTQYALVKGDMLGRIAEQAGISLDELQNINSNTIGRENELQIGDKILLPAGSVITPSVVEMAPDKSLMYPPPKSPKPTLSDAAFNWLAEPSRQLPNYQHISLVSADTASGIQKREASTDAQVINKLQDNGKAAGWGHTFVGNEKQQWLDHPINTADKATNEANEKWRRKKAEAWFRVDFAKAEKDADKKIRVWQEHNPNQEVPDALKAMFTRMTFQLGSGWNSLREDKKSFKKAWAGILAGDKPGTTEMFKDKTGWDQAIYHLQYKNERTKTFSDWQSDTPVRVRDAVETLLSIRERNRRNI